jgi:hypothetical protein
MSNLLKNINVEGLGPLPDSHFLQRRNNGSWEGMNSYSKAKSTYMKNLQGIVAELVAVQDTLKIMESELEAAKPESKNESMLEKKVRDTYEKKYEIEAKLGELYATDPDVVIQKKINEFKRIGKKAPVNFSSRNSIHKFYARHILHQGGTRKKRRH